MRVNLMDMCGDDIRRSFMDTFVKHESRVVRVDSIWECSDDCPPEDAFSRYDDLDEYEGVLIYIVSADHIGMWVKPDEITPYMPEEGLYNIHEGVCYLSRNSAVQWRLSYNRNTYATTLPTLLWNMPLLDDLQEGAYSRATSPYMQKVLDTNKYMSFEEALKSVSNPDSPEERRWGAAFSPKYALVALPLSEYPVVLYRDNWIGVVMDNRIHIPVEAECLFEDLSQHTLVKLF